MWCSPPRRRSGRWPRRRGACPFAPRLALRDLVRYQARAAAALAAITLGLGISVAVVAIAKANESRQDEGNLSDRQLLIGSAMGPRPGSRPRAEALARLDAAAATVAAAVPGATLLTLDVAMPASGVDPRLPGAVSWSRRLAEGRFRGLAPAYVATPELLAHSGIDPATIEADTDLLTARRRRAPPDFAT